MEPRYAFSIPSIEDDTALDCRIYHPKDLATDSILNGCPIKGAILAHPYAPLGGSYDDHVVLAVTETLLEQGYVVGTFNFRGAGDSAGRTSWTGKAELQDYVSFVGFMVYYLQQLNPRPTVSASEPWSASIHLTLGGYSYGSLILARFPVTADIIKRFETAEAGTAAAEIILRARTLAKQTRQAVEEQQSRNASRGRSLVPEQASTSPSKRASPMIVGGEETDPSDRRRSRDSRRSVDVIQKSVDMPHRIKDRIKHRHVSREQSDTVVSETIKTPKPSVSIYAAPVVSTSYLFISPVLLPFSSSLLPPGAPTPGLSFGNGETSLSKRYLMQPTMALFGSNDAFTSSKRLKHWAMRQAKDSPAGFEWSEIDGAGHFWGEPGVLRDLQRIVAEWTRELDEGRPSHDAAG